MIWKTKRGYSYFMSIFLLTKIMSDKSSNSIGLLLSAHTPYTPIQHCLTTEGHSDYKVSKKLLQI